jgi:hypothetical protein
LSLTSLPWLARVFVSGTIVAAVIVFVSHFPSFDHDLPLCVALAFLSSIASRLKLRLPLGKGSSNLSVAYTIDFAALLLLGPNATMLVTLASGGLSPPTRPDQEIPRTGRSSTSPPSC